jgi:hypothetical protein
MHYRAHRNRYGSLGHRRASASAGWNLASATVRACNSHEKEAFNPATLKTKTCMFATIAIRKLAKSHYLAYPVHQPSPFPAAASSERVYSSIVSGRRAVAISRNKVKESR